MKKFAFILIILSFFTGYAFADLSIEWLGWPVYAIKYTGSYQHLYEPGVKEVLAEDKVEIGLRQDGIVVWRKVISDSKITTRR